MVKKSVNGGHLDYYFCGVFWKLETFGNNINILAFQILWESLRTKWPPNETKPSDLEGTYICFSVKKGFIEMFV